MIVVDEVRDLKTSQGPMRTYLYSPAAKGRYPGIVFFSEIFQQTGPIQRAAKFLAGHGFIVAVPEIFHELNPIGTVLAYDKAGTDKGNADKVSKALAAYDEDCAVTLACLKSDGRCNGKLGAMGICIGGHLAFRAAMHAEVRASACFYATDIHKRSLGKGQNDNSLERIPEIAGEVLMIWGRQDPHIPAEGRRVIYDALSTAGKEFTWHEFNAQHAFIRDEGHRYDPELTALCWNLVLRLFARAFSQEERDIAPLVAGGCC